MAIHPYFPPENSGNVFWGEIAPSEHIAQFYEDDGALIDTLSGFLGSGLHAGESTIVIATPEHLRGLAQRLEDDGIDLQCAIREDRYISLDAEIILSSFMVNNWPDEKLFAGIISRLIDRASRGYRTVRAFGEMVALLWSSGQQGATVRLEHLWQQFCRSYGLSLLCSYPKAGFTKEPSQSLAEICAAHSRII